MQCRRFMAGGAAPASTGIQPHRPIPEKLAISVCNARRRDG
jgi:hypothetical protein